MKKYKSGKEKLTDVNSDEVKKILCNLNKLLSHYHYKAAQSEWISQQVNEDKQLLKKISRYLSKQ